MWVFGGCVLAPLLTTWSRGLCGRCSLRTETSYANFSCFKVLNPPIIVQLKVLLLEYFIFLISTELHRQRLQRMFFYCVSYFGETVCSSRKLPWSPCSTLLVLVPACKLKNVQFISKNCVLYSASKPVWNGSLTIFRIFFLCRMLYLLEEFGNLDMAISVLSWSIVIWGSPDLNTLTTKGGTWFWIYYY